MNKDDSLKAGSDLIYLDKCAVCNQPASKSCGACELEFYCGKDHQKEDWPRHKTSCSIYEVRKHDALGFCMVAKKSIQSGGTIASEYPIAIYSKEIEIDGNNLQKIFSISEIFPYSCPSCETGKLFTSRLHRCTKCGVPLCKEACEESGSHKYMECRTLQELGLVLQLS